MMEQIPTTIDFYRAMGVNLLKWTLVTFTRSSLLKAGEFEPVIILIMLPSSGYHNIAEPSSIDHDQNS